MDQGLIMRLLESKPSKYIRIGVPTIAGAVAIYTGAITAVQAIDDLIDNRIKEAVSEDLQKIEKEGRSQHIAIQNLRAEQLRSTNDLEEKLEDNQKRLDDLMKLLIQQNSTLNRIEHSR